MARVPDLKAPAKARWIAVNLPWQPKTADSAIRALSAQVWKLSASARRAWNEARSRVFDIRIQAGNDPHPFEENVLAKRR